MVCGGAAWSAIEAVSGLADALRGRVESERSTLFICVGMQLMSSRGLEKTVTEGLGWIQGDVKADMHL